MNLCTGKAWHSSGYRIRQALLGNGNMDAQRSHVLLLAFCVEMFVYLQKKTFLNKRGPPSPQRDGNISDTVGEEKQKHKEVQDREEEKENKEKKIVR